MSIPFGPRLIGETEKTLNAILRTVLDGTGLSEPEWVTLRLADLSSGGGARGLAAAVADRAHLPDPAELVEQLTDRGLLREGRLTTAGRELSEAVQATITAETAPIWDDLPADDVAAATRVLNEVLRRANAVLG